MMMRVVAFLVLVAAATAAATTPEFAAFKTKFARKYASSEEETERAAIFAANLAYINRHNAQVPKPSYELGVNQFSDLTNAEFKAMYTSPFRRTTPRNEKYIMTVSSRVTGRNVTAGSVDWRTKNAVTPVKNQGQCGSCWSFSTTGSMEGACAIATGKLVSFSEQQLMDCSTAEGNQGCNGGLMDNAFKYIVKNGGLDTEEDYPYTMKDGTCDTTKAAKHAGSITGYTDVPPSNDAQMAAAVDKGPVSVAIEADQAAFQSYKSGVFSGACGTQLDHGVLVVGYTDDYWIVKNSWGTTWGMEGYIQMARTGQPASGICGILMQASYPQAGSGPGPSPPPGPPPPGPPPGPPSPASCSKVEPANRTDCGYKLSEAACNAKGCCYQPYPFSYSCFYPDQCANIDPANRTDCGFKLTQDQCVAKGCCYDDSVPDSFRCFYKGSGPSPPPPGPSPPPPGPTPPPPPPPGPPASGHYGDPNAGPCMTGETNITVTGLTGDFCSPTCSDSSPCPSDVPAGTTAQPQCVLAPSATDPPQNCALICTPSTKGGLGSGGCPEKASCKAISGTGLCTYDS